MKSPPRRLRSDGREFVVAVYPSELDAAAAVAGDESRSGPLLQAILVALRRLARTREQFPNPDESPTVSAVAAACGCDRRTVERNTPKLEAAGLVEVIRARGRGKANRIRFGAEDLRIRRQARGESPEKMGFVDAPATALGNEKSDADAVPAPACAGAKKPTLCPENTRRCRTRPDEDETLDEPLPPEEVEAARALISTFLRSGELSRAAREIRGLGAAKGDQ